jgi:hypothetical protein
MMMNTPFPRGRRPREDPTEVDGTKRKRDTTAAASSVTVDQDFLFGGQKDGPTKKKKKKSVDSSFLSSSTISGLPLGGGNVTHSKKDATIEALSFKSLAKGTKLLGMVRQVNDDFCLVSLPSLLTGYILPNTSSAVTTNNVSFWTMSFALHGKTNGE